MSNSFILGAYWGSRSESLNEVKLKVTKTLEGLSQIDNQFTSWYETGASREKALKRKVDPSDNNFIEKLCLQQVKKGELNEQSLSKMGFLFSLWTGHGNNESSSITFIVGSSSKWLTNSCVVSIPSTGVARERLLKSQKAKSIISLLVEIWAPDYAVLTSDHLRDVLQTGNKIGWITCHRYIRQIPKMSRHISYQKEGENHWFNLNSEEDYDINMSRYLLSLKEIL